MQVDRVRRKGVMMAEDTLPEGCIAHVLSMTTPVDACRLSLVATVFHSAADSDAVWEKFLPFDYKEIISRASANAPPPFSHDSQPISKKDLYFWLSDHPLIIDHGTKSFSLEKKSGKRCYMLAARDLDIVWGDTPRYWRWTSLPDSRFDEAAELINVCWLEIKGKMNVSLLSPDTTYTAYLVFKSTEEAFGFEYKPAEVSIGTKGGETKTRTVYLDPNRGRRVGHHQIILRRRLPFFNQGRLFNRRSVWAPRAFERVEEAEEEVPEVEQEEKAELEEGFYPKERGDGWMEIELGDYFNGGYEEDEYGNKELEMSLMEVRDGNWKCGLIVQGIEIRPKSADT